MSQIYVDKKPSVDSTSWAEIFSNTNVKVYEAYKYYDFYKLVPRNGKVKYFFGESAWADLERYSADNQWTFWDIFS
jgi:hypothetical protein